MKNHKPSYDELAARLAVAEPIVDALKSLEVDAIVGREKVTFLLLKEIGDELLHSQAGFRAMFELPGVGMIQADSPSFRFTKVNEKFCEITGFSNDDLLGKTYLDLTDPRDRRRDMKGLALVFRGKADAWKIEKRCVRSDGSVIWLGVHGVARRDKAGRVVRIMAMVSDISAHKQAELELRDRSVHLRKLASELAVAEQRERRRIGTMLRAHINELLVGVKSPAPRTNPGARAQEKSVSQALKEVQRFVNETIALPGKPAAANRSTRAASKKTPEPADVESSGKARSNRR